MTRRFVIVLLALIAGAGAYAYFHDRSIEKQTAQGTEFQVLRDLRVTYLAVPATFDAAKLQPERDFGVAANGNVLINTAKGVFELKRQRAAVALEAVEPLVQLESFAVDRGSVMLGIVGRYFGEIGPDRFEKGLPLPPGQLRLTSSTRAGSVYLFGKEPTGTYGLYIIRDDGTLAPLSEFRERIRAVGDDHSITYVATDRALYALGDKIRVVTPFTQDFGPADAMAASSKMLFIAANNRIYALGNHMLLAIAQGIQPQMIVSGNQLYCWDAQRRLLVAIDIGPLLGKGKTE